MSKLGLQVVVKLLKPHYGKRISTKQQFKAAAQVLSHAAPLTLFLDRLARTPLSRTPPCTRRVLCRSRAVLDVLTGGWPDAA